MTIISVALPEIEAAFVGSSRATLSWIFTAYNVGVASLLLIGGWLAERFGRKRVFLIGLAIFAGGSVLSGLAPGVELLISGRAIQAVGGALLLPASLALILHTVADDKRDAAIGVWGSMAGLAAAIGPTLGGLLVQYAGWRWVFLVNVPIALGALVFGRSLLTEARDPNAPRTVDFLAVPTGAAGTGLLVFAIVAAGAVGLLERVVVVSLIAAAVLLLTFVRRSVRHPNPVFPPAMLTSRSYRVGLVGTGLFAAAFAGWLVLAPTFLVEMWDYSVLRAGFAISPAPLAMAITAGPAGKLAHRIGYRKLIAIGCLAPVAAVVWWTVFVDQSPNYLVGYLPGAIMMGAGVGVGFPMLTAASMRDVAPARYAIGAAGNTTMRQVAMALGISGAIAIVGSTGASLTAFQTSWMLCGALALATSAVLALRYPGGST